jgi:hypothetical protein
MTRGGLVIVDRTDQVSSTVFEIFHCTENLIQVEIRCADKH